MQALSENPAKSKGFLGSRGGFAWPTVQGASRTCGRLIDHRTRGSTMLHARSQGSPLRPRRARSVRSSQQAQPWQGRPRPGLSTTRRSRTPTPTPPRPCRQIQVNGLLGTFLAWKGQADNKVQYKYRLNGTWHATRVIPGAYTNTSPSAALFATKLGQQAVFVAWKSIGKTGGLQRHQVLRRRRRQQQQHQLDHATCAAGRACTPRLLPRRPCSSRPMPRTLGSSSPTAVPTPRADRDRHRDRDLLAAVQLGHQEGEVRLGQRHDDR